MRLFSNRRVEMEGEARGSNQELNKEQPAPHRREPFSKDMGGFGLRESSLSLSLKRERRIYLYLYQIHTGARYYPSPPERATFHTGG